MGWASEHIKHLQEGKTVSFRPHGKSMTGRIESGQLCTVEPCDPNTLAVGNVVLCKVRGAEYLHIVKDIRLKEPKQFQIGNNLGYINGWIEAKNIYGKLIKIED